MFVFQDSAIALQALAKFAEQDTNRALYNVRIEMEATATSGYEQQIALDRQNWQDVQYFDVPRQNTWGQIASSAQGTGMVLFQLMARMNVEYPDKLDPKSSASFYDVYIERKNFPGKNFSVFDATVCAE